MYMCTHMYITFCMFQIFLAVYSKWDSFGECSVTCGGGTQSRSRTCIAGSCDVADMVEVKDCNTQCCPGEMSCPTS